MIIIICRCVKCFEQEGRAVAGNHRAMQGTCRPTESLHLVHSSGNAVNRKNIKTIGKHKEVVEKPLYKRISEGLMHVAEWHHGTPGQKFTKFGE